MTTTTHPVPRGARPEQRLRTRNKIVAAAREAFIRNGYLTSTIEEITQLAGVSRAGLYTHFTSKQAILEAVLEDQMDWYLRQYRLLSPQHAVTEAGLIAWFRSFVEGFRGSGEILQLFRLRPLPLAFPEEGRLREQAVIVLGDRVPAFRLTRPDGGIDPERRLKLSLLVLQVERVCLEVAFGYLDADDDAVLKALAEGILRFVAEPEDRARTTG